jgi:hypothetical protein
MSFKTVSVRDEKSQKVMKFVIQNDETILYNDLKRVFGDITGLSINDICLPVINDRIQPLGEWTNEFYQLMRPLEISSSSTLTLTEGEFKSSNFSI